LPAVGAGDFSRRTMTMMNVAISKTVATPAIRSVRMM
jgi:hypothetical protein